RSDLVPVRALPGAAVPVLPARRGGGRAGRHEYRPLRRVAATVRRPGAVHRDHAPETDDGGRRYALRRHDGRGRGLAHRLAPGRGRRLEARPEVTELGEALAEEIAARLGEPGRLNVAERPSVVLVVGVNGTGKTTTIGKLANELRERGRSVVLAAADTFRAAAAEQLEIGAARSG